MRGIKRFWREHSIILWFTIMLLVMFGAFSLEIYWVINNLEELK